jgi:ABC-type nitrate/sulfonate/bicarbonate transport system permease component
MVVRLGRVVRHVYSVALLVLVWEGSSRAGLVHPFLLPPPSAIGLRLAHLLSAGDLGRHMALSLYRTLASFGLAIVIAVPLGLAMARIRLVAWFCEPLIAVGFPTPKIVFLHIFVLWFGLHDMPKIVMATVEGVLPIVTATYLGTRSIDVYLLWSARNLGTSPGRLLWKVMLPAALPQIMNGVQIALPICFIVIFVTEMLLGGGGLGDTMILAQRFADSEGVFAGMVTVSLLGYLAIRGVAWVRQALLHWHVETQERRL